jgi:hypothetical protein
MRVRTTAMTTRLRTVCPILPDGPQPAKLYGEVDIVNKVDTDTLLAMPKEAERRCPWRDLDRAGKRLMI